MNKNRSVVLIAGLDHSRRSHLIAALQRHGYIALTARDAFEALEVAIERKVDLLLTEDDLPGLTGRELIEVVRNHQAIKHSVLISDSDTTPADRSGLMYEHVSFTVTLFNIEQLLLTIGELVLTSGEEQSKSSLKTSGRPNNATGVGSRPDAIITDVPVMDCWSKISNRRYVEGVCP